MKKTVVILILLIMIGTSGVFIANINQELVANAQTGVHIVVKGDSMWKIAVKYETGLSEIIKANPHIKNPALIYPNQKISIPETTPLKTVEGEVIRLVNVERAKNGLYPLKYHWELSRVSRYKSQDMITNRYFSHTSPVYGSPFTMLSNFGINYMNAAENIAYGQRSASEVMNTWMNSAGHRTNILSTSVTHIGVGAAKSSNGTMYFTQMFVKFR